MDLQYGYIPYYTYNDPSNNDVLAWIMKLVPKSNFYLPLARQ